MDLVFSVPDMESPIHLVLPQITKVGAITAHLSIHVPSSSQVLFFFPPAFCFLFLYNTKESLDLNKGSKQQYDPKHPDQTWKLTLV